VLGYQQGEGKGEWKPSQLAPGQALKEPQPLYRKLDPEVAEQERARLGQ
jgi:methionyl-tRNA synthetase